MFRQIKSLGLIAITIGVVMSCTVPALAAFKLPKSFIHGERYKKETGEDAYCLRKILYKWTIDPTTAGSDEFAICEVRNAGDYHVITCSGVALPEKDGKVTNDETAEVRFSGTASDGTAEVVCAKWYENVDQYGNCENFIAYAYPVASPSPDETETRAVDVNVDIVFWNLATEWNDETNEPIYAPKTVAGSEIYYAKWQQKLDEDDMTEDLWTCVDYQNNPPPESRIECLDDDSCNVGDYQYCGRCYNEIHPEGECNTVDPDQYGIEWLQAKTDFNETTFELYTYGQETNPFRLGKHKGTKRLLLRYYTKLNPQFGVTDYEVVQFKVRDWFIPTVSEWGLVVIALLVLAAGTIVIRRRRAMAAQA